MSKFLGGKLRRNKSWTGAVATALVAGISATLLVLPSPVAAASTSPIISSAACSANDLTANDDGSSAEVDLPFDLNFYGTTYSSLWVNNNGNVTFDGPLTTYTPFGLIAARTPIIAPFFADVDTRGAASNVVQFGYGETIYDGRPAFCVNWIDVGYYPSASDKLNSFQLLLVDRSDVASGAFDTLFNYEKIQWESGSASGGSSGVGGAPARAGFASGSDTAGASVELEGSGVSGAFLDSSPTGLIHQSENSLVNGRYIYKVRSGQVLANKYVALGDSFQSGEGDHGNYQPNTDRPGNYCHRSKAAYSELLVERGVVNLDLDFRACSGAVISDLEKDSSLELEEAPYDEGSQLDALGADTRLVTIGIGGNDVEFAPILTECAGAAISFDWVNPFGAPCVTRLDDRLQSNLDSLASGEIQTNLRNLYRSIREKAPYARVIVVSYPRFFKSGGSPLLCSVFKYGDQSWINDAVISANGSIGATAISSGFDFVNMADVFEGHTLCSYRPAMNQIALGTPGKPVYPESFHPNQLGHSMFADALTEHIGKTIEPSFVIRPQQTFTRTLAVQANDVHVTTTWPGSDVVTTLISPSGLRYTRDALNGAQHTNGPTYESWDLAAAENGTWTVEIYGADVDADGEDVQFNAYAAPVANARPVASFAATASNSTLNVDASASTDSDGSIVRYEWDFGDGTTATGATASHTYADDTSRTVILRVQDDQGATAYSSQVAATSPQHVFRGTLHLTNENTIEGDVRVGGDFSCDSSAHITGDLVVSGTASLTNNCVVDGTLYAGGKVSMTSAPHIRGDVITRDNLEFQSTAKIDGSAALVGGLTVTDGKSISEVQGAQIGGDILEGQSIPAVDDDFAEAAPVAPPTGGETISWTKWMNREATRNSAPEWSAGLTSQPGCTIAPWASSINGSSINVDAPLLVDARESNCAEVALQDETIRLSSDLTIVAKGFSTHGQTRFVSADGKPHTVRLVTETMGEPGVSGTMYLSAETVTDGLVQLNVESAGLVRTGSPQAITGHVYAESAELWGTATLGRK